MEVQSMNRNCPPLLFRKILFTLLIGLGVFLFGAAYFVATHDSILLILSAVVFVASMIKGFNLYLIVKRQSYETIEGLCVFISGSFFSRYKKVKILGDDDVETTLRIHKNIRIQLKVRYKFYFSHLPKNDFESEYLNAALASDSFLGFERVSES